MSPLKDPHPWTLQLPHPMGAEIKSFAGLEEEGSRQGSTAGGLQGPQHLLPPPQPASNSLGLPGAAAGL